MSQGLLLAISAGLAFGGLACACGLIDAETLTFGAAEHPPPGFSPPLLSINGTEAHPHPCAAITTQAGAGVSPGQEGTIQSLPACDPELVLDDMQDGDSELTRAGGRTGRWSLATDGTGHLYMPPSPGAQFSQPVNASDANLAMRIAGGGFAGWGCQVVAQLNQPRRVHDLSAYTGIDFRARGKFLPGPPALGRFVFEIASVDTLGTGDGGICDHNVEVCYDHHKVHVALTPEWQYFSVKFGDLRQSGTGTPVELDLSRVIGLVFTVSGDREQPLDFDFWIDDLTFFVSEELDR